MPGFGCKPPTEGRIEEIILRIEGGDYRRGEKFSAWCVNTDGTNEVLSEPLELEFLPEPRGSSLLISGLILLVLFKRWRKK